ncbi:hypothetical protein GUJ93_ZPchr0013g34774 [Zizania palustris]|uniref:Uncharacterized protein n=1 Tax=Zizania palustris TaxID=103762 RepID=A0A8J6BVG1_ZIZPA|nr:hypothetical protein GUJ93_ZPchr0013g34774 [Zizania palustris]
MPTEINGGCSVIIGFAQRGRQERPKTSGTIIEDEAANPVQMNEDWGDLFAPPNALEPPPLAVETEGKKGASKEIVDIEGQSNSEGGSEGSNEDSSSSSRDEYTTEDVNSPKLAPTSTSMQVQDVAPIEAL